MPNKNCSKVAETVGADKFARRCYRL